MYSHTFKAFGAFDATDRYDWIFEDLDKSSIMTDDDSLRSWASEIVSNSKAEDIRQVEEDAETLEYPHFGYTIAQVFETAEAWLKFKFEEIEDCYADEIETVMKRIHNWLESE